MQESILEQRETTLVSTGIYPHSSIPAIERFCKYLSISESGCWEWTGYHFLSGYGEFFANGKPVRAHRFSYLYFKGDIPDGLEPDHLCRNRGCVNPDHLEAVTHQENVMRGRNPQLTRERCAAKTHCPKGHPYDSINTYIHPDGSRKCRTCRRGSGR